MNKRRPESGLSGVHCVAEQSRNEHLPRRSFIPAQGIDKNSSPHVLCRLSEVAAVSIDFLLMMLPPLTQYERHDIPFATGQSDSAARMSCASNAAGDSFLPSRNAIRPAVEKGFDTGRMAFSCSR